MTMDEFINRVLADEERHVFMQHTIAENRSTDEMLRRIVRHGLRTYHDWGGLIERLTDIEERLSVLEEA